MAMVDVNMHSYDGEQYYADDFWIEIFAHLDASSLCKVGQTCYSLHLIAEDKMLWTALLQKKRGKIISVPRETINHPKQFYKMRKDFETITEAIKAANPEARDRLYLSPGLYKESLILDKPIDIIGEGAVGSAIIEGSTSNTIEARCTEGLIANVAIRQTGHWFCLDVEKGSIRVEGCDIMNSILSAIKIGKEGSPSIVNNKIHDTHEAGVAVFGGSGVIDSNEFYRNRYGSIEIVYATANPIIRANKIHHNKGYGIHIHTHSRPIVQGNFIYENESDGLSCWKSAEPYVSNNKIYRNRGDGIYIHEEGKGTFEGNEIFSQKLDGIRTSKSSPSIQNNSIHNNEGDGVRIVMGANPVVENNKIFENNRVGVHVYRDGCGKCIGNHIYANKNAGIQVYGGGTTEVRMNKIESNKCSGIYISDRASVKVQNNEIAHNGDCGLEVVSGAHVSVFEGNHIHHNKTTGFALYPDTRPPLFEQANAIESNGIVAVETDTDMMDICEDGPDEAAIMMQRQQHNHSREYIVREGKAVYPRQMRGDSSQAPEVVSFLAEKAIQDKCCTFTYTREYYHAQYWYECRTCTSLRQILGRSEVSVCEQCAKSCHVGHDLSPRKFGHFYCDCGQTASCKCLKEC